jgi:hypothetical protein
MDDVRLVRLGQPLADLDEQVDGLADLALLGDVGPQRLPRDVLHRDVPPRRLLLGLPDVVDREDVGMVQRRRGLGLEPEARHGGRIAAQLLRQELDGHVAVQPHVPRPVDHAHPARTQRRDDLIRTETRAGGEAHGRE